MSSLYYSNESIDHQSIGMLRRIWNQLNCGLVDVESVEYVYTVLKSKIEEDTKQKARKCDEVRAAINGEWEVV